MTNSLFIDKKSFDKKNYVFALKENTDFTPIKKNNYKPFNNKKIIESINKILKEI